MRAILDENLPIGVEPAVDFVQSTLHYSATLRPRDIWEGHGCAGSALCSTAERVVKVLDGAAVEDLEVRWGIVARPWPSVPLCGVCVVRLGML